MGEQVVTLVTDHTGCNKKGQEEIYGGQEFFRFENGGHDISFLLGAKNCRKQEDFSIISNGRGQ